MCHPTYKRCGDVMAASHCPQCGQELPNKRYGVEMSALKARIVDMIVAGGADGVPVAIVFDTVFKDRRCTRRTLTTHVWQINEMLADEGHHIIGFREHSQYHTFDRYRMTAVPQREKAHDPRLRLRHGDRLGQRRARRPA